MFRRILPYWSLFLCISVVTVADAQDNSAMWNAAKRWKLGIGSAPPAAAMETRGEATRNPVQGDNPDSPPNTQDIQVFNPSNFWQSENSIGVNFSNPNHLMVSTNGRIPGSNPVVHQPWAFSTDGGVTWPASMQSEDIPPGILDCFGDPVAFFDVGGKAYYCTLGSPGGIYFVTTTNFGATWSARTNADNLNSSNDDKQHATADFSGTFPNNVYAAWTDFGVTGTPIQLSRSTDRGLTWLPRVALPIGSNRGQGVHIAIGPNGEVYPMWAHYTTGTAEVGIGFAKSTDGGATFSTPTIAFPLNGVRISNGGIPAINNVRTASFPYHDVDRSNGPRRGWIYVVTPELDVPLTGQADIYIRRSTNGGSTWSNAIRVNGPDVAPGRWQFMPSIAVDPATGGITVSYYSMDSVGTNFMTNRYAAYSVDGGNTWDNWVISDVRANWAPQGTPSTNTTYNGDYYETAAMGGKAWALWTDRRSGSTGASNRAYIERIIYGENFGWIRGTVTNLSGGAPLQGVAIDFVDNVLQQTGSTDPAGLYFAGAYVDTPGTTANRTLRGRKFGFVDTTLSVTLTRNDTLTRNFQMRPAPGGTLSVHSRTATTNLRSYVEVKFGTLTVVSDSTNGTTGLLSAPLPTGTYSVRVDAPSPYVTRFFASVVVNANQTTNVDALTQAVTQYSPAAMRDTLVVAQTHQKTLQLVNTTTDSVPWRLSTDEAVRFVNTPEDERQIARSKTQQPHYELPKGAEDPRSQPVGIDGRGGPDAFGYVWIDSDEPGGPTYDWVEIKNVGTQITGLGDDTNVGPFPIGFPFPFYGNTYNSIRMCTNGFLSFTSTSTAFTNAAIPATSVPNDALYPFWDDLNFNELPSGTAWYHYDAANQRFIVQWDTVSHFSPGTTPGRYTFQVILKPDGNMLFQYRKMEGTLNSATIGIENADGTIGLQTVFNSAYMHDSLAILFKVRGVSWLNYSPAAGVLPPSSNLNVTATFDATGLTAGTTYNGTTFLDVTHPDVQGTIQIPTSLTVQPATQPLLIVNKDSINYGATPLSTTVHDTVTARNGGALTLNITSITSNNPRFTVTPANATVPPGDSVKIRISYTPPVPAIDTGRVIILSNSLGGPRRDIMLRGSGYGVAGIGTSPSSFTFTRGTGSDTTRATLRVRNTGTDTLRYKIDEVLGGSLASVQRSIEQQQVSNLGKDERSPSGGGPIIDGQGGPDAFGYRWIDSDEPGGPQYNWVEIKNVGTEITGLSDDTNVGPFAIGFTFPFYGNNYDQIRMCTNGWLSFTSTSTAYDNTAIPTATEPNNALYPFWDDLNFTEPGGTAWYLYDAVNQRFIVQWDTVSHYSPGTVPGRYTFQVILKSNGDMLFQYRKMEGTIDNATIGIENQGGTIALQTVFNAAYMHDNLAILLTKDVVPWMSVDPVDGTIVPGDSASVEVRIHPAGLGGGNYSSQLRVTGNTPDTVSIPVSLTLTVGVEELAGAIPTEYSLTQNYPNPFNPSTTITYGVPVQSNVSLRVFNVLGQEVASLVNEAQSPGFYKVTWNGQNFSGNQVSSGVYFFRMEAASADGQSFASLKKMLFLK